MNRLKRLKAPRLLSVSPDNSYHAAPRVLVLDNRAFGIRFRLQFRVPRPRFGQQVRLRLDWTRPDRIAACRYRVCRAVRHFHRAGKGRYRGSLARARSSKWHALRAYGVMQMGSGRTMHIGRRQNWMGNGLIQAEFPEVPVERFERKRPEHGGLFNFQVKTPAC